ncbi:Xaa-Pro peptidase family protein [Bradyrhizobium sp. B097]|uniref:M24 family metallopeptidase n=1 Tax=Bradyrhizobium sp. B097 TaxID=3140244 RepID=UPI00318384DD
MSSTIPSWPSDAEISSRISRLRDNMAGAAIEALVLTSRHNFEYYTGFRSLYWISDARPMLAIVRRDQPGVSILISRIEQRNARQIRNADVRPVYYDGFTDSALQAAATFLHGLPGGSAIGFDYGFDMFGRGSVMLIDLLRAAPHQFRPVDAADLIWRQRLIKSEHEFQSIRAACNVATDSFFDGLAGLRPGVSEYEFGQLLEQRMIGRGADSVEWLPVRFGRGDFSYTRPNADIRLQKDDFVWVDMGVRRADAVSDLNRVAKAGKATPEQEKLYEVVRSTTLRLAEGIRPGMTGDDAFALYAELWSARNFSDFPLSGRVGHGSGSGLTEPPSLLAGSTDIIQEDTVLHVEPKLEAAGGVFQVEEVFRVTTGGPEFLSTIAPAKLPVIEV